MPSYENILESFKKNNLNQEEENNNTAIELNVEKKNFIKEENEIAKTSKEQIKNTTQTKPILSSLNEKTLAKNIDGEKSFIL